MTDTVVNRDVLQQLAAMYAEMEELRARQASTEAELIRWCVMALTQTPAEAQRRLQRERPSSVPTSWAVAHKVSADRKLALLQLQWLATRLEDQGVRSSDSNHQSKEIDHV